MITKLSYLTKDIVGFSNLDLYRDVETMFMPIEDEYYKNKIIKNNQLMVDQSSIIICYVDFSKLYSGAKKSVLYAKRKNKTIINLFNNLS